MVDKLPALSGKEIVKTLEKCGYVVIRRESSHIRMFCLGRRSVTVPDYKIVSKGLLRKILRDAILTVADFNKLRYK
ncbi:MAG: type II toxin-antitoxin system HicA family toxin [Patescibacteria group bacterium]